MIDYLLPANHIAPSAGTWPVKPVTWCGGVSRVAKGADCKSAGLRLRRFESYLPHQPSLASRATARQAVLQACGEASEGGLAPRDGSTSQEIICVTYMYILRSA